MSEKTKLKPGTYRLSAGVQNPSADRRVKRDWRSLPVWAAGGVYLVEVDEMLTDMIRRELDKDGVDVSKLPLESLNKIKITPATGGWSHQAIYDTHDSYEALARNLVPCEETPEALLTRLGFDRRYDSWNFLLYMIKLMGADWFERTHTNYSVASAEEPE